MKNTEITKWLAEHNWTEDRWGHWHTKKVTVNGQLRDVRMKMQTTSIRYEVKRQDVRGEWVKLASDYYKNCYLMENKLHIGNMLVG